MARRKTSECKIFSFKNYNRMHLMGFSLSRIHPQFIMTRLSTAMTSVLLL